MALKKSKTSKTKKAVLRPSSLKKKTVKKVLSKVSAKPKISKPKIVSRAATGVNKKLRLKKFVENPIVTPNGHHNWESQYVFNPAAVCEDGKVHLIYRAIGNGGVSVFGYASTKNGLNVDERLTHPIFAPSDLMESEGKEQVIIYNSSSGGSWGGCEDPRITKLDGKFYITYTAFNCYPRVAITSISEKDFISKHWKWREPVLISPPGEAYKNWVVFPEKIKGKYAILHCIFPDVQVAYVDSMDFDGKTFIKSSHPEAGKTRKGVWDSRPRGVGPPPIKTDEGWLIIYHAIDDRDPGRYKMGAIILDYENPEKVLYRSVAPILEPDEVYENDGFKSGVVYSCGAVTMDGTLFVYYGGADTVVCVATANLNEFLSALKKGGTVNMKKAKVSSKK